MCQPRFLRNSPLANAVGFVDVDKDSWPSLDFTGCISAPNRVTSPVVRFYPDLWGSIAIVFECKHVNMFDGLYWDWHFMGYIDISSNNQAPVLCWKTHMCCLIFTRFWELIIVVRRPVSTTSTPTSLRWAIARLYPPPRQMGWLAWLGWLGMAVQIACGNMTDLLFVHVCSRLFL